MMRIRKRQSFDTPAVDRACRMAWQTACRGDLFDALLDRSGREPEGCGAKLAKAPFSIASGTSSVSALIVARSTPFRESLAVLVRAIPHIGRIDQVEDLSSALSENAGVPPDLMLCDFEAVQDETVDTLRRVKEQWPRLRCVVLVQDETAFHQATAAGADVVLTKGVLAARLLETIEELLSGGRRSKSSRCEDLIQ